MLIANFWKSMTESFSSGDEDALDPGHSSWQDMGVQAMSEGLAKTGGFGLGKMILKHLEPLVQNVARQEASTNP
jgi:Rod binding domain-containing protein